MSPHDRKSDTRSRIVGIGADWVWHRFVAALSGTRAEELNGETMIRRFPPKVPRLAEDITVRAKSRRMDLVFSLH